MFDRRSEFFGVMNNFRKGTASSFHDWTSIDSIELMLHSFSFSWPSSGVFATHPDFNVKLLAHPHPREGHVCHRLQLSRSVNKARYMPSALETYLHGHVPPYRIRQVYRNALLSSSRGDASIGVLELVSRSWIHRNASLCRFE